MNEKELTGRAKSGDFDAFMELVDRHKAKVYSMIRRLAGNDQDAEDTMQDTLLKAIDKIDQFRGDASFGTWLYSIGLNMARAQFARLKQVDLKPLEEYLPGAASVSGHGEHDFHLMNWKDPHEMLEGKQLKSLINDSIMELPYKYREAFLLRYLEELSVKEVARLTKQSEASAKSRILRARLALRDKLSMTFEEEDERKLS